MNVHKFLLGLTLLLGSTSLVQAAPSFCGEHAHTFKVTVPGVDGAEDSEQKVTVIMDHQDPLRWYYFPNELTIGRKAGKPEFTLIKYQLSNANTEKLPFLEGGIVQFSVTMDLSGITNKLKSEIANQLNKSTDPVTLALIKTVKESSPNSGRINPAMVRVSAMPFDKITVMGATAPGGDTLVSKAHVPTGTGPAYGTQKIPMTFELTKLGVPVLKALTTEANTGVQVSFVGDYHGVLPPISFKVTVDWVETYKHFSENVEHRSSVAANLFGADIEASTTTSNKKIADELITKGCVKIEILSAGDAFGGAYDKIDISSYLDPLLAKIYKVIFDDGPEFEALTPDQTATAAKIESERATIAGLREAPAPPAAQKGKAAKKGAEGAGGKKASGGGGGGLIPAVRTEVNVARLNIEKLSKYNAEFTFKAQAYQKRVAAISGFIGIGNYHPEVQDSEEPGGEQARTNLLKQEKLLIEVGDDSWDSNTYSLPDIDQLKNSVSYATIGTSIIDDEGMKISIGSGVRRQATWKQGDSEWKGDFVFDNRLVWPLLATANSYGPERFSNFQYRIDTRMKLVGDSRELFFTYDIPLTTGETTLGSPLAKIRTVTIDPIGMFLEGRESYTVTIKSVSEEDVAGKMQTVNRTIRVTFKGNDDEYGTSRVVLLPISASDVTYSARLVVPAERKIMEVSERELATDSIELFRDDDVWKKR